MATFVLVAALLLGSAADTVTVKGTLPKGTRLEFRASGSPDVTVADASPYQVVLAPDRYALLLTYPSGRRVRGAVSLAPPDVELNVQPEATGSSRAPEYDLLADWQVIDESGKPVGDARLVLEAEPGKGNPEPVVLWVTAGEQEKESDAAETTPDGRCLFRVRESRINPDRIVALRVNVEAKGYRPAHLRYVPVLEFSPSGHLYAKYPEEELKLKLSRDR